MCGHDQNEMRNHSPEVTKQEIIRLSHDSGDSRTLRADLLHRLRAVVPYDYAYFSTTDPSTLLITSSVVVEEPPSWVMAAFLENEYQQRDYNKFSDMVRSHTTVGALSHATGHDIQRSPRYRQMLAPMAMADEMRAVFVSDSACWGTLCLHRQGSASGFTPEETNFVAQCSPHITSGIRKALLFSAAASEQESDGPGMLLLSDDLSIVAMTAAAKYWLTELIDTEHIARRALPQVVLSIAASLKAMEHRIGPDIMPKARLRTRSGHWLVLHASRMEGTGHQNQIAVMFEKALPTEISPLIMQAYGLTKREREILQCVLHGWSTKRIAGSLHISANTVQDHLKAIFAKVNVNSRGELAAHIFAHMYQPRIQADTPLNAAGQFVTNEPL